MSRKFFSQLTAVVMTCVVAAVALAAGAYSYLDYERLDPSQVSYKISATTSGPRQSFLPGTKQNVKMRIYGSKPGKSVERQLNGPFAAGESKDLAEINGVNVGYPCSIALDPDGPDGWLAESVQVDYFYQNDRITRATFSRKGMGLGWIDGEGCGQEPGINLALSGTASQSSNYRGGYLAGTAIDGKTDQGFMHTNSASGEWWQVKLAERSLISTIEIWNRPDGYKNRLTNFNLSILALDDEKDSQGKIKKVERLVWNWNLFPDPRGFPDPSFRIHAPEGTMGDIVKIQLKGATALHMAEVQVFGTGKSGFVGACQKAPRFYADDTLEACDELQRARNAPANPSTVTAASATTVATLQTIVPSPNDQAQLVRLNATGFVQNAAAPQLATLTIDFSVKDTNQIWQPLSVDTAYFENGLSAEVSKIVPIKSAAEPLRFANLTVPYGAFQNAAYQTLQSRRDPYEIRVEAVLSVGGVELDRKQTRFKISMR